MALRARRYLRVRPRSIEAVVMTTSSDLAEVATLTTVLEDLSLRVTAIAEQYSASPDSAVSVELFNTERSLAQATRTLRRAKEALERA
jgi:hypothetical protein